MTQNEKSFYLRCISEGHSDATDKWVTEPWAGSKQGFKCNATLYFIRNVVFSSNPFWKVSNRMGEYLNVLILTILHCRRFQVLLKPKFLLQRCRLILFINKYQIGHKLGEIWCWLHVLQFCQSPLHSRRCQAQKSPGDENNQNVVLESRHGHTWWLFSMYMYNNYNVQT